MGVLITALALILGYGTAYLASEDVRYLTRAGIEQTAILQKRRPIETLVADPQLDPETREYLRLVLAARGYAAELGLEAGETYTSYSEVGRDTLLLVLSASPKNCICPRIWKYPIVGRIPYKGFFDLKMAQREAEQLAAKGYDTYLRPAAAYSTLGWFEDPLLSTALIKDSVELASLVFHEIAHNSLYVKSATPFNESFAQLVGYRAAEEFFSGRGDSALANLARDRWADEMVLGEFYHALLDRLEAFYATKPVGDSLEAGRLAIGRWARAQLEGPLGQRFRRIRASRLADRPINNAALVGVRLYRTHLDWFDRWYELHGHSVKRSVAALRELMQGASGDSAFIRLERALADSARAGGA
ncbi:MAG TPA: aminopeptidase [Gemmatimonadales bacterium]|jgi:predicted aminopeptidase|nr:aminopeptidase [Gemmatimonadales bacterium]